MLEAFRGKEKIREFENAMEMEEFEEKHGYDSMFLTDEEIAAALSEHAVATK